MKIACIQDIHTSPSWIDETRQDMQFVCEVAMSEKVDAICIAGDFFHRAVMATDKHKFSEIIDIAQMMQDTAPVYYIYGTVSHDAPGAYSALDSIGWKEVNIGKSRAITEIDKTGAAINQVLIMGIPEITPAHLMSRFPELNKQDIIAKQYELVNQVIEEYYKPLAMSHNGPVHFMGHGHVSGAKFRDDQKPRTSDFMFSEDMLKNIGADYYQFGHLHLRQQFKTINGGYGGSSHLAWGDIGFKARFDIIEFWPEPNEEGVKVTRFDYDKPERQKIVIKDIQDVMDFPEKIMMATTKDDIDLWVDIECDKAFADQFDTEAELLELRKQLNIGPLSKITCNIQHEEHIRVDTEEYEACKTTEDLYKIYDPEATPSILHKIREAETETHTGTDTVNRHNFEFLDLYLRGSKAGLENGVEEIRMDWSDFNTGANLIIGPNGTGKSFILGFCTPYSEHLPTGADLKSLFELKDSQIIRRWRDGENVITQRIEIDPTLSAPTAKYYMDINGSTDAFPDVKGNKTPFDEAVEKLFGTAKMFMACVFRGQKDNKDYPSLEKARETDLREIFTELSGIDRTPMKKYAHDKSVELSRDIDLIQREIETIEGMVSEPEVIKHEIDYNDNQIEETKIALSNAEHNRGLFQAEVDKWAHLERENEGINKELDKCEREKYELYNNGLNLTRKIDELSSTLADAESLRNNLNTARENAQKHSELLAEYLRAVTEYRNDEGQWIFNKEMHELEMRKIQEGAEEKKTKRQALQSRLQSEEADREKYAVEIKHLNKPCEHCGKLSSSAEEEITRLTEDINISTISCENIDMDIADLDAQLDALRDKYSTERAKIGERPTEPEIIAELKGKIDSLAPAIEEVKRLEPIVAGLDDADRKLKDLEAQREAAENRTKDIDGQIAQLNANLNKIDDEAQEKAVEVLRSISDKITQLNTEIGRLQACAETLRARLAENDNRLIQIKEKRVTALEKQGDISEWDRIEKAFSPKGIEALELSLIAPIIDRTANELLQLQGGRFRTETITQEYGKGNRKNDLIERFKILVHDSYASEVKNLPCLSPGQLAWVTSALYDAIYDVSSNRNGREWLYKITDETDGPLQHEVVPTYYEMLGRMIDGKRKLVSVSHSPAAHEAVPNIIDVREFFINYKEQK